MSETEIDWKEKLSGAIDYLFAEYGIVVATLTIGFLIGYYFKFLIIDRKVYKQIELRIEEKDNRIAQLNRIVIERLNKIQVQKKDRGFFKRLKKSFKLINKK